MTFWVNLVKISQKSFFNAFKKTITFLAKGYSNKSQIIKINQWPLFTFLFENEVCGVNEKSASYFDVIIYGDDF